MKSSTFELGLRDSRKLEQKDTQKTKRQNKKVENCIGKKQYKQKNLRKTSCKCHIENCKRKSIDAKGKLETSGHYAY